MSENEMIMTSAQEFDLARLKRLDQTLQIRWDHDKKAPALVSGRLAEPFHGITRKVAVDAAMEFLEEHNTLFRMDNPKRDLALISRVADLKGNTTVAMQQTYKGFLSREERSGCNLPLIRPSIV